MDEFADRLKRDAQRIEAEVPDALRARIDAGVRAARRAPAPAEAPNRPALFTVASVAAGLAALAAVLLVLYPAPEAPPEPVAVTTPPPAVALPLAAPLNLQTVQLTEPLQLELERLRTDLEKARDSIERDLRSSL